MSVYKIAVVTFEIISTKCAKQKILYKIPTEQFMFKFKTFQILLCIYISYLKNKKYKKSMLKIILESFPLLFLKDNKLV